jgi:ferrous iron transport protein B
MKTIALTGNPNSGKTTLFNRLTGSNQYVGNWPGVTVEKKEGLLRKEFGEAVITDLPGIYSLSPYSPEEVITRDYILKEKPDVIINIIDGTNIERNLYLTLSLMEIGRPVVVAVNMMDEVSSLGGSVDCDAISKELNVPVVPISARKDENIQKLVEAALSFDKVVDISERIYSTEAQIAIARIENLISEECGNSDLPRMWTAIKLLENDIRIIKQLNLPTNKKRSIDDIARSYESTGELGDRETMLADLRYRYITNTLVRQHVVKPIKPGEETLSDKIDRFVTNRILALPIFFALISCVFYLTFGPFGSFFSNALDILINDVIAQAAVSLLTSINAKEWLVSLVTDGIISGVGGVLVFLPQIAILFFFLSLLEDSGYMARAAFIMDRLFRRFGLSGKSFIPLLMGFGCSVPAIMATRTLENERDRRMTIILTPFMSCAARWPVYALFISAFFEEARWLVALSIYTLGIVVAVLSGIILKYTLFRGETVPFVMELPLYRLPTAEGTFLRLWDRVKEFLLRAGTLIFAMSIFVWFLSNISPSFTMAKSDQSIFAQFGRIIAPIFAPLGFGEWRASVSLLTGLIAKEAVVSTMGILYGLESSVAESGGLVPIIRQAFTPASALAFMTFTLLYVPCVSTLATTRREMNSRKWTAFAVAWQLSMAYIVSFIVYNVARLV